LNVILVILFHALLIISSNNSISLSFYLFVYLIIVTFEFNTCYSMSYSVKNICNNSISVSFYQMVYLVIGLFECNTCYSISYSVNNICNNSISLSFFFYISLWVSGSFSIMISLLYTRFTFFLPKTVLLGFLFFLYSSLPSLYLVFPLHFHHFVSILHICAIWSINYNLQLFISFESYQCINGKYRKQPLVCIYSAIIPFYLILC
jgi:hypothetical protein